MRLALAGLLVFNVTAVLAADPLHVGIDRLVDAKRGAQAAAAPATDGEFLRRASLDFTGEIPTSAEAKAFLADTAPGKREVLIEKLFASPKFPEKLAESLHIMLMERRGDDPGWRKYLTEACKENKPWEVMAREILCPDFADAKQAPAGYFAIRRLEKVGEQTTDFPGLTRDVGRMFMGVDLQCCQCHNHLTVKSYKQQDFNGLFYAIQNLAIQKPAGDHKTQWLAEGAITAKYDFVSVLTGVKGQTAPRVPFGEEVAIPELTGDAAWKVKPDKKKNEVGVPVFSPMQELATRVASKENPWFVRNMANRLWWLVMGRGLVEPLDLNSASNPPSNPELMDLIDAEFVAHNLDLKWLLHELALTKAYAQSSEQPAGGTAPAEDLFAVAKERPLSAEQLTQAFLRATGEFDRVTAVAKAEPGDDAKKYGRKEFEAAFRTAFANAPKEPELTVNPTLKSALFLRNSEPVLWSIKKRDGNLVDRLSAITEPGPLAEELYLSVLSRLPTAEEKSDITDWLAKHAAERERAVGDCAWALLSSSEFFSNH